MKNIEFQEGDYLITADSSGEIRVWDILEFLKGVDAISQDYSLQGLQPLSSVSVHQRILCLEATGNELKSIEKPKIKKEKT